MKTEWREITVKQPVYIADDGTEFADEDACLGYEFDILKNSVNCYDSNYNKTDKVESCDFVHLVTGTDVKIFIRLCEYSGCVSDGIDKPGLYMYGCNEAWVNLDEVMFHIRGGLTKDDQT